jgi:protease I
MPDKLKGKHVAVLATNGVEQSELTAPMEALRNAGASVDLISLDKNGIKAWNEKNWGDTFDVDVEIGEADPDRYDSLVLPGGVMNPDRLRIDARAVEFVKAFFEQGKPVAAICHAPWLLVEADVVRGRRVTSWPSLQTDLRNAGADWIDQEVVADGGLVTSRKPQDLPAFCEKMVEEIAEGRHTESKQGKRRA